MKVIKVLYVDDEENNLNSFRAAFRRSYEIYTAISAKEALDILQNRAINVIVSDQRMPEITGVELFKVIKDLYPDPVRVLLTGYTDINVLTEAINEGNIFRYITKPWNELELDTCIKNANDFYNAKFDLKLKVEELQKTNDDLNRFVYSISHELRAPLATALGVIGLAKLEKLYEQGESASEYWAILEECCQRLDHNLTGMLQYYKNSRQNKVSEQIDFDPLVKSLIDLHKRANGANGEVSFILNIHQPVKFYGDAFRTEIILSNLISNAVKYQKPEEIHKTVTINIDVNNKEAIITVIDNGCGIPQSQQDKIFTQFFRGKYREGTGLGLFILKEALTKIEGKVSLVSETGKGSTFTVVIPNAVDNLLHTT